MEPSIYDFLSQEAAAAAESLSVMMQKDRTTYACGDYLHRHCPSPSWPPGEDDNDDGDNDDGDDSCATAEAVPAWESDRTKVVDWCYSVVDKLDFDREVVAATMDLVDRFMSTSSPAVEEALRDRHWFQLVGMVSLYISIKTHERPALGSDFFAALSHGIYSISEMEDMELEILTVLSWRINAPSAIQMAYHILSLTLPLVSLRESTWGFILDEVRFQTEHAVRDYRLSTGRRSTVALAAIFNALDRVGRQDRRAVRRALLYVANLEFDFTDVPSAAKTMRHLVNVADAVTHEPIPSVAPDVSKKVQKAVAAYMKRGTQASFDKSERSVTNWSEEFAVASPASLISI